MGRETYTANATQAREFRIIQSPDGADFVLQWRLLEGTIATTTSIKISREGLLHTLSVIDAVRDRLPAEESLTTDAPAPAAVPDVVAYRIHWPYGEPDVTTDAGLYEYAKWAGHKVDWLGVVGGIAAAQKKEGK